MSLVEPFEPAVLEQVARAMRVSYYTDGDDDVLVIFAGAETGGSVNVHLSAEGDDRTIFVVRVVSALHVPADHWPRLYGLVNRWHADRRWPRVYINPVGRSDVASIYCDGHLSLGDGAYVPLLVDFTEHVIASSFDFLTSLHKQGILDDLDEHDLDQLELELGSAPGVLGP